MKFIIKRAKKIETKKPQKLLDFPIRQVLIERERDDLLFLSLFIIENSDSFWNNFRK